MSITTNLSDYSLASFSNYDLVFFAIIISSSVLALIKGGLAEILSLSKWLIAIWIMYNFKPILDNYILPNTTYLLAKSLLIFLLVFIFTAILISIVKFLGSKIIGKIGLGGLNYALGFSFGAIRGIIICSIIIIVIETLSLDQTHSWRDSKFMPLILPVTTWITNVASSNGLKLK